jgi:hypothetical protein
MSIDRADKIGTGISAALHVGLIAWIALSGALFRNDPSEPVQMTEVAVMSESDFQAMMAAAPKASDNPVTPEAPTQASVDSPTTPAEETPVEVTPPAESPAEPTPTSESKPDLSEVAPPVAEVQDSAPSLPSPPVEVPSEQLTPDISPRPLAKPATRVAPTPTEAPAPDAKVSETAVAETKPEETPEPAPVVEPPKEAAAPPEASTELLTETNKDQEQQNSAPSSSDRPKTRPARPAPEKVAEAKPATDKPAADKPAVEKPAPAKPAAEKPAKPAAPAKPQTDSVNDALAEAMGGTGTGGRGLAASGPPMTSGEKDAFMIAVKACWNVGSLSSEALRTTVTIGFDMNPDGKPNTGSMKMIDFSGGSETAAKQAYEAGRRAIIRCGASGFPLPSEKFDYWSKVEIVFDPNKMRMK